MPKWHHRAHPATTSRQAEPDDWPSIWPIFRDVVDAGRTYPWRPGTDEPTAQRLWMMRPPAETWVVVDDEDPTRPVIATAFIEPNQPGLGSHVAHCGFMVARHARGRGHGRRLVMAMMERATALGYRAMQFNAVVADNPAVSLYIDLGFDVAGRIPGGFERADGPVDLLVMHRSLTDP